MDETKKFFFLEWKKDRKTVLEDVWLFVFFSGV